jgi:hypothetical protein
LLSAKYSKFWKEEQVRASEDLQDKIKKMVRDNPNSLRSLP